MPQKPERTCLLTEVRIRPGAKNAFADWQAKYNSAIAAFPGFLSLEFLSGGVDSNWLINQRFINEENTVEWKNSEERKDLIVNLKPILEQAINAFKEEISDGVGQRGGVTEVFVTEVSPDKVDAYRKWIAKIHQVEAKFPGFKGCYVQSPSNSQSKNWITLLQFDSIENLENWISSPQRKEVLKDSDSLIKSLESHRVISPYAGWFSSVSQGATVPPAWKQSMIVLLVLFPIVMLEMMFLNPLLSGLNKSLATFIGNAISVQLISWPTVPIAIYFLRWWLSPPDDKQKEYTILGSIIVCILYAISIAIFWYL